MSPTQPTHAAHGQDGEGCSFGPMLSGYLDGELTPTQQASVDRHLAACSACSAELSGWRGFSEAFDSAKTPSLMMDRREAILNAVFDKNASRRQPKHLWYVRRVSAVAAAVALLAVGQIVYKQVASPGDSPTDPAIQKTDFHEESPAPKPAAESPVPVSPAR